MKKNILNLLFFIGIILSIYGFIQKKFNLFNCQTDGCLIANEIIKIDSSLLYLCSFMFFLLLIYLNNNKNLFSKYKEEIFFSGLIFESILFSTMLFTYNEFCIECAKMISLLILIGIILNYKKMIFFISVISAVFLLNPIQNKTLFTQKYSLITKKDCPHCKKVKKFLKKRNIKYNEINVKRSIDFLNNFKIKSVPVLVILEKNKIYIINGDNNIIDFFIEDNKKIINNINDNLLFENNFEEEGCLIESKKSCN